MFRLKPLSRSAVKAALIKAVRYRVLNEPMEAESICRDVLGVEPDNQKALVTLLLALTDQFPRGLAGRLEAAWGIVDKLESEYERYYYSGIICERRAKFQHRSNTPHAGRIAYQWLREAMDWFEKAEAVRPEGNDEAILRWNTCARILMLYPEIQPAPAEGEAPPLTLE